MCGNNPALEAQRGVAILKAKVRSCEAAGVLVRLLGRVQQNWEYTDCNVPAGLSP